MESKLVIRRRLESQGFSGGHFSDAAALVGWMGCVQSQDFAMAKWAIGVRFDGLSEAAIDADFNAGRILRTHVLRPTWHFILLQDIGWMLQLSAGRIRAFTQPWHRRLGIDAVVLRRSKKIMVKAMEGGQFSTRQELAELFRRAKINTDDIRMNFLMIDAELDGLICSGPRKGKQFTYGLLEERVSGAAGLAQGSAVLGRVGVVPADLAGDAALAELARRYFLSRGPATLPDFAWWGGLSLGQARRGLEAVKEDLDHVVVGGQAYWFGGSDGVPAVSAGAGIGLVGSAGAGSPPPVLLLPAFDEYSVAYKDRSDVLQKEYIRETAYGLKPVVVVNGRIVGVWRRVLEKKKVVVEVKLLAKVNKTAARLIGREAKRYGRFLGVEAGRVELR